jgi:hypothetical protein
MTTKEALRLAASRVHVISHARGQYQVNHYDVERRAWWDGSMTTRPTALRTAWEYKVAEALRLLGSDDADHNAHMACDRYYPKDWRQVVREEIRTDRLFADEANP